MPRLNARSDARDGCATSSDIRTRHPALEPRVSASACTHLRGNAMRWGSAIRICQNFLVRRMSASKQQILQLFLARERFESSRWELLSPQRSSDAPRQHSTFTAPNERRRLRSTRFKGGTATSHLRRCLATIVHVRIAACAPRRAQQAAVIAAVIHCLNGGCEIMTASARCYAPNERRRLRSAGFQCDTAPVDVG